jgi:selenoprotein W-related protein
VAAELKGSLAIDATLTRGSGGIFEVRCDGEVVYSKAETGKFPEPGELTEMLRAMP